MVGRRNRGGDEIMKIDDAEKLWNILVCIGIVGWMVAFIGLAVWIGIEIMK